MRSRQQRYGQALRGPFVAIRAEIRRRVAGDDLFGLEGGDGGDDRFADARGRFGPAEQLADYEPDPLDPQGGFALLPPDEQHDRFMAWLERQHEQGVLEVIDRNGNPYVRAAAKDGVRTAQREMRAAGVTPGVSTDVAFSRAVDARKLRVLYGRNYALLEGITDDVASEISRVITDGFLEGLGPDDIAENIADRVDSVGLTRATRMARYEIMNAHNFGTLARYEDAEITHVEVITEDPCPKCIGIEESNPYTLEQSWGLIPAHPNCVCVFAPAPGAIAGL